MKKVLYRRHFTTKNVFGKKKKKKWFEWSIYIHTQKTSGCISIYIYYMYTYIEYSCVGNLWCTIQRKLEFLMYFSTRFLDVSNHTWLSRKRIIHLAVNISSFGPTKQLFNKHYRNVDLCSQLYPFLPLSGTVLIPNRRKNKRGRINYDR